MPVQNSSGIPDLIHDIVDLVHDVSHHPTSQGGSDINHDVRDIVVDIIGILTHPDGGTVVSDVRLKEDVVPLERLGNGLGLYRFRYKWSDEQYVGVMAQEVAETNSDAVVCGSDGYLRVDYGRLGLRMMTWDEWVAKKPAH